MVVAPTQLNEDAAARLFACCTKGGRSPGILQQSNIGPVRRAALQQPRGLTGQAGPPLCPRSTAVPTPTADRHYTMESCITHHTAVSQRAPLQYLATGFDPCISLTGPCWFATCWLSLQSIPIPCKTTHSSKPPSTPYGSPPLGTANLQMAMMSPSLRVGSPPR